MMVPIRKMFFLVFRSLLPILRVFLLLLILIAFFTWFALLLFYKKNDYFMNTIESALNMFSLLTADNFPDIMVDSYEKNRISVLFFVVYMLIGHTIFMVQNLMKKF